MRLTSVVSLRNCTSSSRRRSIPEARLANMKHLVFGTAACDTTSTMPESMVFSLVVVAHMHVLTRLS